MNIQSIAIDQTTAVTVVSDPVHLDQVGAASVQLSANVGSGDIEGQWLIEGSNDYVDGLSQHARNAGRWVNLGDGATPPVAITATDGDAEDLLIRLGVIDFLYLRITFTRTAGSGPIKATVGGKNV
jgi:hypothetical protein